MPIACHAYYTVRDRLRAFLEVSRPQLTNLSLLTFGLFAAGNSQLPRIAVKLPLPVGAASLTQRLRRLLRNEALAPGALYAPVARFLLAAFAGGSARLILDATDLGGRLPVLFVAVAYRGRALPLAWRMLPAPGCSEFSEQKALLSQVAALVAPSAQITLLADREYGSVAMTRWCLARGWHFCLRLKKNRWLVQADGQRRQIGSLPLVAGGRLFVADVRLPALPDRALSLCCGWSQVDAGDEAWYILSDLPADHRVLATYATRFHIEEMFRDFKEFGFRQEVRLPAGDHAPAGPGARLAPAAVRVPGARLADERGRLGQQARPAAANRPAQGAATELFPDRMAFPTTAARLRPATPLPDGCLHLKKLTVTQHKSITTEYL